MSIQNNHNPGNYLGKQGVIENERRKFQTRFFHAVEKLSLSPIRDFKCSPFSDPKLNAD